MPIPMASPSRRRARMISFIASLLHFFFIILQVPLFRVPCRVGICTSPVQLTTSQLMATELFPAFAVKALLYPGAIAKAFIKHANIPSSNKLLRLYNFTNLKKASATTDLLHLEILAGSYLSVAGSLLGLLKPGRMSLFGALLIIWGFIREAILRKSALYPVKAIHIPAMSIVVVCAFLSIRRDVRKIIRSGKARASANSLWSKAK